MKMNKIMKNNKFSSVLWKNSKYSMPLNFKKDYTVGQDLKTLQGINVTEAVSKESLDPSKYFSGKKVVLVGVVGAFTGTCNQQIPEFIKRVDEFKGKGVDEVGVLVVNDSVVTNEWAKSLGVREGNDSIKFISDWSGSFTKALDKQIDLSSVGFGVRSTRFTAFIDNGVIKTENVSSNPGKINNTDVDTVLSQI
eukprot:TRINITY_DN17342_c0_g1_i1.p1 TRINITY_DN17342_c0_g1~~TRINITY_DN17342_c0_g1_i1.p1  ORF type:complete len:194 (-),score=61.03 TRINITY_DN17342_c0_g1_i1:30-611(-)